MAGETIKTEAVCLWIRPWSRTSHVTGWLAPHGRVVSLVKGAVRPKSAFLGQYDLNYTCEILYYARAHGETHALRECSPINRRDALRENFRALAIADHARRLADELAPSGDEGEAWYAMLTRTLDRLTVSAGVAELLRLELDVLELAGLAPDIGGANGFLALRGERTIPVSDEVAKCLDDPLSEKNPKILLDAARVIGVYYSFHLDIGPETRRTVLKLICKNNE